MVRVAHIGVIEPKAIAHAIVSQLNESPQAIGDFTGVKEARLLGEEEVTILGKCAADGAVRKRRTGVSVGHLQHQADGRYLVERQRLAGIDIDARDLLEVIENVAVELEFATERA